MSGFKSRAEVEYDGVTYSLRAWCIANNASYERSLIRWRAGIRDPIVLIYGHEAMPKMGEIADSEIEFLRKTRNARKGSPDEWQIAAELIGQPYVRIPEIRKLVMG